MGQDISLVIRGGTVIDGTGAPGFEADVAVAGGRIVQVGEVSARGAEEIDARGRIVTPGFVDIHTHYDGQAIWDSHLAPSAWHGVTTAVMGNCGVGFAPVRPADRDRLIELMEGVEDIPGAALHEGLDWQWESFGEYLTALERRPRDIDICAQLPHAALRVYVMGERATRLEAARQDDIARMRALAEAAMRAGAFGFTTSRTISHRTLAGEHTPTLRATEAELTGIALGLRDAGSGMLELVSDWNTPDPDSEFAMVRRVVEASGRPLVFSLNQRHDRTQDWLTLLALSDQAAADGLPIRPVFPPRPIGILLGLQGSQNPFSGTPSYKAIAHLPLPARVAAMRDPAMRARILSEDPFAGSNFPLLPRLSYARMFPFGDPPDYEPTEDASIAAMAAREGRTAPDVAYDMLLREEGRAFIFAPLVNYADCNLDPCREMLSHPNTIVGLGDGGAHVGFISDASFPTFLLTYWGRDRTTGRFPLEELVRRQTSDTAGAVGLHDRGVIAPGKKADLNVIDFARLALGRPDMVFDLPAGGRRLLQPARGYDATIV
ncbi:MAG: amidohydrolase family protein, partial [Rhodospirillales bacterium]|nr:amidohydrolase family protein [Rhodospirillales bacterium]